jgi:hypothetical protein
VLKTHYKSYINKFKKPNTAIKMKLGKDSALEKLRTSKDKLIQALKDNSNT